MSNTFSNKKNGPAFFALRAFYIECNLSTYNYLLLKIETRF